MHMTLEAGDRQDARSVIKANQQGTEAAEQQTKNKREQLKKKEQEEARRKQAEEQYVKAVSTIVSSTPLGSTDVDFSLESTEKDEKLTLDEREFVAKITKAVQESDPARLKAYLGPQHHKSKKQFQKDSANRYQDWLKARRESDFYLQATHLVKVFARKVTQDALWASYEKDLDAKSVKNQKQPVIDLTEQKDGVNGDLQQELAAHQKRKQQYEALQKIYLGQGLKAFGEALQAPENKSLFEFFNSLIKPVAGPVVLKEKDKKELKQKLQEEFRKKEAKFAGLLMAPTPERTSTSDAKSLIEYKSPRTFSERESQRAGREPISLASVQYQQLFRPVSPNESTAWVLYEKKEELSKALIPMGDAEWYKNHQLVLLEHNRPKALDLDRWLDQVDALIRRNNDLVELVFDLDEVSQQRRLQWTQLEDQQKQAEINLQRDQEEKTQQFEKDAHKFFAVNGKISRNNQAEIDKVRSSKLGERSADDVCFANKGILLLHTALAQYQKNPTSEKLQVVDVLMERGASLYVPSPANDLNALAYLKANTKNKEAINNWDLTGLTFKNMPALSPFTQAICRYLAKEYCPLRKKDSSSAWTSFWHAKVYSHDVNNDRLDDLRELAEQLWKSASRLDDTNILVWIKQKAGEIVPDDMLSSVIVKATPAKGVSKSPLYLKLLGFVRAVEKGELECFRSTQGMSRATPKHDDLSVKIDVRAVV